MWDGSRDGTFEGKLEGAVDGESEGEPEGTMEREGATLGVSEQKKDYTERDGYMSIQSSKIWKVAMSDDLL